MYAQADTLPIHFSSDAYQFLGEYPSPRKGRGIFLHCDSDYAISQKQRLR